MAAPADLLTPALEDSAAQPNGKRKRSPEEHATENSLVNGTSEVEEDNAPSLKYFHDLLMDIVEVMRP